MRDTMLQALEALGPNLAAIAALIWLLVHIHTKTLPQMTTLFQNELKSQRDLFEARGAAALDTLARFGEALARFGEAREVLERVEVAQSRLLERLNSGLQEVLAALRKEG